MSKFTEEEIKFLEENVELGEDGGKIVFRCVRNHIHTSLFGEVVGENKGLKYALNQLIRGERQ